MFGKKEQKPPTQKQEIGKIGEDCACKWLEKGGYKVIDRNYLKKWGELDIVAKKGKILHFIEVKSVSRSTIDVTHVTSVAEQSSLRGRQNDDYRPEDNMHSWKLKRLGRAIQSYLLDKDISDDIDWQFDVVTVYIDIDKRQSKVFILEDVIL
jgi:putative endonuclease